MSVGTRRPGGLWRQRDFGLFWTGESISQVGNSVTIVVVPLVAIETLHTSTFIVTLLNAMVWLPWLAVGVPAGAWVDRLPPRAVMLACDAICLVAYASIPVAAWLKVATVAQLVAVTLIAGTATVFFNSAYQVLLPGIVAEADLTEGNAKLMGSREIAQIAGPGIGGGLAEVAGPAAGLLADAASFAVSLVCLTAIRRPRDRRSGAPAAGRMLDGLRLVWTDPYLRVVTAFSALANLALTGMDALIVVFLVRTVGLSAGSAGLVLAAFGVGGALGAMMARPLGQRLGSLPAGLLLPLAQRGPSLALAVAGEAVVAFGVVISNVLGASWRQAYVPPEMLGRVSSATMTVAYAMMPAGALLAGALATASGVRTAMWVITAVIGASGLVYLPSPLRRLRDLPPRSASS
jgi:predicted MFS family arabinose efflux permease